MQQEEILTTITSANPDSVLEIALAAASEGRQKIELRRLSWGEGVGWYRQQTLQLDVTEAETLLLALRGNRSKWAPRLARPQGKVIPFPLLAASQHKGRAQGHVIGEQEKERAIQNLGRPLRKGRNL